MSGQRDRQYILRVAVAAVAITFLFTTVAMSGPCRARAEAVSIIERAVPKLAIKQAIVKPVEMMQAVVQSAPSGPKRTPLVRAAVAQALLRLPTTPLTYLMLFVLAYIARVLMCGQAPHGEDGGQRLSHGQHRALLQVFLI